MESRLPAILFISGIALLILALITGEAKGGIIVIFPFVIGTGLLSLFGMLFIFLSFIIFIFSFPKEIDYKMQQENRKGILFIGPIPIIFSGDLKVAWLLILTIIFLIFIIIFILFFSFYYSKMVIWISF